MSALAAPRKTFVGQLPLVDDGTGSVTTGAPGARFWLQGVVVEVTTKLPVREDGDEDSDEDFGDGGGEGRGAGAGPGADSSDRRGLCTLCKIDDGTGILAISLTLVVHGLKLQPELQQGSYVMAIGRLRTGNGNGNGNGADGPYLEAHNFMQLSAALRMPTWWLEVPFFAK